MKDITNEFNTNIMNMIGEYSYAFYLINRDQSAKCTCILHETSQPNPGCPTCLGTGRRITIRKVIGASQETKIPPTFKSDDFIMSKNYYINSSIKINEDDLIIDGNEVFWVFSVQNLISLKGTLPYTKYNCVKKRFDAAEMLINFNKAINK